MLLSFLKKNFSFAYAWVDFSRLILNILCCWDDDCYELHLTLLSDERKLLPDRKLILLTAWTCWICELRCSSWSAREINCVEAMSFLSVSSSELLLGRLGVVWQPNSLARTFSLYRIFFLMRFLLFFGFTVPSRTSSVGSAGTKLRFCWREKYPKGYIGVRFSLEKGPEHADSSLTGTRSLASSLFTLVWMLLTIRSLPSRFSMPWLCCYWCSMTYCCYLWLVWRLLRLWLTCSSWS